MLLDFGKVAVVSGRSIVGCIHDWPILYCKYAPYFLPLSYYE